MTRSLILIANPSAKNNHNQVKKYQYIIEYLQKHNLNVIFYSTQSLVDLHSILKECIAKGHTEYIALGGDGTFHYLVNALVELSNNVEALKMGVIPCGTGNDWLKNFKFSNTEEILNSIIDGNTQKIDIGKIEFQDRSPRFFVNIAGIGFNGAVIQNISRFRLLGKWAYYVALLYSFIGYKCQKLKLIIDDIEYDENTFILTIGNGKYAGGDMLLCPSAILDDGYLDVHLIQSISKLKLIQNIFRLKNGTYLKHLDCIILRAKYIQIIENESLYSEADGEYLGRDVKSFEILAKHIYVYS